MRIFIDTNVLIDFVCDREKFLLPARRLFAMGYMGKANLIVCALSYVTTLYVGRKYDKDTVLSRLSRLSEFVEVADLTADSAVWALASGWKDYEDAVQYGVAVAEDADCIVTRNKRDYASSTIPVYTAEEVLKTFM